MKELQKINDRIDKGESVEIAELMEAVNKDTKAFYLKAEIEHIALTGYRAGVQKVSNIHKS